MYRYMFIVLVVTCLYVPSRSALKACILFSLFFHGLRKFLPINSNYFPTQRSLIGFCNGSTLGLLPDVGNHLQADTV
jgi:hypothetical protein